MPVLFVVQSIAGIVAFAAAAAFALMAARKFGNLGFVIIAVSFFLSVGNSVVGLTLQLSSQSWNGPLGGILSATHFITLLVMVSGWAWAIFAPNGAAKELFKKWSAPGVDGSNGKIRIALRVAAIFSTLASIAAALWALLVCFAAGMKSVPSLNYEDALIGGLPSLLMLLVCGGICFGLSKVKAGMGYLITALVGCVICLLGLALIILSFADKP